jgi:hypothetical protein
MTKPKMIAALCTSVLLATAGCSVFDFGSYDSFESWFIGDPQHTYSDLGAEDAGQVCKAAHGPFLAVPYALRDVTRIPVSVFAFPYYAAAGTITRPSPAEQPDGQPIPVGVEPP